MNFIGRPLVFFTGIGRHLLLRVRCKLWTEKRLIYSSSGLLCSTEFSSVPLYGSPPASSSKSQLSLTLLKAVSLGTLFTLRKLKNEKKKKGGGGGEQLYLVKLQIQAQSWTVLKMRFKLSYSLRGGLSGCLKTWIKRRHHAYLEEECFNLLEKAIMRATGSCSEARWNSTENPARFFSNKLLGDVWDSTSFPNSRVNCLC